MLSRPGVQESLKPFTSKITRTRIPAKKTTGCSQNDDNKKFDEIKNCGRLKVYKSFTTHSEIITLSLLSHLLSIKDRSILPELRVCFDFY